MMQQEGEEGSLVLKAPSSEPGHDNTGTDDPDVIQCLIHYLYYGDYSVQTAVWSATQIQEDDRTLSLHAKIFAAATKYNIGALQQLAYANYNMSQTLLRHGEYSIPVEDLAEAIRTVYISDSPAYKDMQNATAKTW